MNDEVGELASYRRFPSFNGWIAEPLTFTRVDELKGVVAELDSVPREVKEAAVLSVRNAAAIETGAIENLYDLGRGITITAAVQAAQLETLLQQQGEKARGFIEAQMAAYDYVLDFVTRKQPLAQAWVRDLHKQLCASQKTYRVRLPNGDSEERALPLGQYKSEPNHVLTGGGKIHFYAPVNDTEPEMTRLLDELRTKEFEVASPVDQVSYAHYAFVAIHPFTDGNGRVARAFSSIFTYRPFSVPLLISADQRIEYFNALERADQGAFRDFRSFVAARIIQSVRLMRDSILSAQRGSITQHIGSIKQVYQTRGGYVQVEIDEAGHQLLEMVKKEIADKIESHRQVFSGLNMSVGDAQAERDVSSPEHRRMLRYGPRAVRLSANSHSPAEANIAVDISVELPKDAVHDDLFRLVAGPGFPMLELSVDEVLPSRQVVADIRAKIYCEDIVSATLEALKELSRASIRNKGYTVDRN